MKDKKKLEEIEGEILEILRRDEEFSRFRGFETGRQVDTQKFVGYEALPRVSGLVVVVLLFSAFFGPLVIRQLVILLGAGLGTIGFLSTFTPFLAVIMVKILHRNFQTFLKPLILVSTASCLISLALLYTIPLDRLPQEIVEQISPFGAPHSSMWSLGIPFTTLTKNINLNFVVLSGLGVITGITLHSLTKMVGGEKIG